MKKKTEDVYYFEKELRFPGCIAKIYRPILTEEERAKRMKVIEKAAANLIIEAEKQKVERELSGKMKGEKKNE